MIIPHISRLITFPVYGYITLEDKCTQQPRYCVFHEYTALILGVNKTRSVDALKQTTKLHDLGSIRTYSPVRTSML